MALGSISRRMDTRGIVRWRVRFDLPSGEDGHRRQRQVTATTRRAAELLLDHIQAVLTARAGAATAESVDCWLLDRSSGR